MTDAYMYSFNECVCRSVKEFCSKENTLSAAAEDGYRRRHALQALKCEVLAHAFSPAIFAGLNL